MSFWKNAKPIETKEYAVMYGNAIIEECHRNGKNTDFKLLSVLHLKQRNIWRFEYGIDQRNVPVDNLIDCGALYVVIDGNNGKFIKAWAEE